MSAASPGFLFLFDLIVLTGLLHYYRRLGYPFLLYGSIFLGLHACGGFVSALLPLDTGALVRAPFTLGTATLAACCALNIARLDDHLARLVTVAIIASLFALGVGFLALTGEALAVALAAPASALLVIAAFVLLRQARSMATCWFSALALLLAVGLPLAVWIPVPAAALDLTQLLIGVTLVMTAAERVMAELATRDARIERYAEDRRRLEIQFSQAQKLESLGMLAGGIAHDFNNMLTSILGYASLAMKKLSPDSEVRKDLYMVMSGARQAVDLTSQMLIYAGKGAVESEAVDISEVVSNMDNLVQSVVPSKIRVVQRLGRDLPSLRGDRAQLGQAVMNLIANAVDAMEDGGGTIEISTGLGEIDDSILRSSFFAEDREPGAYLYLRVSDSGIGMSNEQIDRIFDPFYSEKHSGKGLGLASLSGIVRQHKGFIQVQSAPGEGTEFTVFFPLVAVSDAPGEIPPLPSTRSRQRGRVLLADDDSRIRSLMASILESDHYTIVSAEDGREALSLWREHKGDFDVLVIDCTMPRMSGVDVYRQLRADGVKTPIVLVSGYHQEQVARHIENDPQGTFVKKPFNVDDFLREVNGIRESASLARRQRL